MTSTAELWRAPPLGLYVHIPWCVRKCPYCDFNSHQIRNGIPVDGYIRALLEDLDRDLPLVAGRTVSTVYFGGGTPSLFSAADIERLITGLRARLDLADHAEISLEANPGTVEHDSFAAYREAGINRISLGAQSFDGGLLDGIGRIHGRREVEQALLSLRESGVSNFNIDLMYGLPGQSSAQAAQDIELAIAAGPGHISHYQLTLEPNTAFAAAPPVLPADEACWAMQEIAGALLEGAGYRQYEISAWSRPGNECRHNVNYWRYGDFLGIGAGAHAKLTDVAGGTIRRLSKQRHPRAYLAGERLAEERLLETPERIFEFFLNRFRLREELRPESFCRRTGLPWDRVAGRIETAVAKGLLVPQGDGYRHSDLGWRFVNDLQAIFLP